MTGIPSVSERRASDVTTRIVLDVEWKPGDKLATKEAVAMALEQFGEVKVKSVTDMEKGVSCR